MNLQLESYIHKSGIFDYHIAVYIPNAEIHFYRDADTPMYAEAIVFGKWRDISDQDCDELFKLLKLQRVVDRAKLHENYYFDVYEVFIFFSRIYEILTKAVFYE